MLLMIVYMIQSQGGEVNKITPELVADALRRDMRSVG